MGRTVDGWVEERGDAVLADYYVAHWPSEFGPGGRAETTLTEAEEDRARLLLIDKFREGK